MVNEAEECFDMTKVEKAVAVGPCFWGKGCQNDLRVREMTGMVHNWDYCK